MLIQSRNIIFFLVVFLISIFSSGQEGLLIKNNKNGQAWFYEKGSKITYIKFHNDEYSSGKLNELIDTSSIVIGKDTVLLSDISDIRKRSPLHKLTRIIGMPLMFCGSLIMADGAASAYRYPENNDGINFFLVGAGMFSVGYLPYLFNLQHLDVGYNGN